MEETKELITAEESELIRIVVVRLKEENQRLKEQWNTLNETCKQWERMFAEREGKDGK